MTSLVLTAFINTVCYSSTGCPQAIEAASKQSGIYDSFTKWEKTQTELAVDSLKKTIKIESEKAVTATLMLATAISGNKTAVRLGTGFIKETYILENHKDYFNLSVNLNF